MPPTSGQGSEQTYLDPSNSVNGNFSRVQVFEKAWKKFEPFGGESH